MALTTKQKIAIGVSVSVAIIIIIIIAIVVIRSKIVITDPIYTVPGAADGVYWDPAVIAADPAFFTTNGEIFSSGGTYPTKSNTDIATCEQRCIDSEFCGAYRFQPEYDNLCTMYIAPIEIKTGTEGSYRPINVSKTRMNMKITLPQPPYGAYTKSGWIYLPNRKLESGLMPINTNNKLISAQWITGPIDVVMSECNQFAEVNNSDYWSIETDISTYKEAGYDHTKPINYNCRFYTGDSVGEYKNKDVMFPYKQYGLFIKNE